MACVILVSFSLAGRFFLPRAHLILIVLPKHFVSCVAGPWRIRDTEDRMTREPCPRGDLAGQVLTTWIPFPMKNRAGPGLFVLLWEAVLSGGSPCAPVRGQAARRVV